MQGMGSSQLFLTCSHSVTLLHVHACFLAHSQPPVTRMIGLQMQCDEGPADAGHIWWAAECSNPDSVIKEHFSIVEVTAQLSQLIDVSSAALY